MMLLPALIFAGSIISACTTSAPTFSVSANVVGRVFMTERAMGNRSTKLLVSLNRRSISKATAKILLKRDGFHMVRIDAASDAAEMIDLQPIWDRPTKQLVSNAMCFLHGLIAIPHDAVPAYIERAGPDPATGIWLRYKLRAEPLHHRCSPIGILGIFRNAGHASIITQLRKVGP